MLFKIISQNFQDASYYKKDDVDFLLEEDRWNDFGYHTQYHLHATARLTRNHGKGAEYLGPINIMKLGQKEDEIYLLGKQVGNEPFSSLPEGFYSMSTSIGLFEALHRLLKSDERREFVGNLRLILSDKDEYYSAVKDDECFTSSLLRWTGMNGLGLQTGRSLLGDELTAYDLRREKLTVRLNDADSELVFDFSPLRADDIPSLPNGTIAFIGKNGSGKSTALYNIAALMYSNLNERENLRKTIGEVEPKDITMSRLLIFSYNPFDNFLLPGELSRSDLKQWAEKVNDRSGRFIFCGFRDVEKEAALLLGKNDVQEPADENDQSILYNTDLHNVERKPISTLSYEAFKAHQTIMGSPERKKLWDGMVKRLKERHQELYGTMRELTWAGDGVGRSWSEVYGMLSTGHKFFIHTMTHAFAYCKRNSMLMFDEPENHLQWPLLGFMMQELRLLLDHWSSVMLVATHSPVILQDMLSENIRIVRRIGDKMMFQKPRIETYCESFGEISSEVFDLTSDRVFFFDTLRQVFDYLNCEKCDTANSAVERVKDFLGNISIQAIHYVVQLWMDSRTN